MTDRSENFPSTADATTSDLKTIQVSPMAPFDVADILSLGIPADIVHADVTLKNAISDLDGTEIAFGVNGRLLWQPVGGTRSAAA